MEGYSDVYDGNSMLFMDFRRHHSGVWAGTAPRCSLRHGRDMGLIDDMDGALCLSCVWPGRGMFVNTLLCQDVCKSSMSNWYLHSKGDSS